MDNLLNLPDALINQFRRPLDAKICQAVMPVRVVGNRMPKTRYLFQRGRIGFRHTTYNKESCLCAVRLKRIQNLACIFRQRTVIESQDDFLTRKAQFLLMAKKSSMIFWVKFDCAGMTKRRVFACRLNTGRQDQTEGNQTGFNNGTQNKPPKTLNLHGRICFAP